MAHQLLETYHLVPEHKVRDPSADVSNEHGPVSFGYRTVPARRVRIDLKIDTEELNGLRDLALRAVGLRGELTAGAIVCKVRAR